MSIKFPTFSAIQAPDYPVLETTAPIALVTKENIQRYFSSDSQNKAFRAGAVFHVQVFSDVTKDTLLASGQFQMTMCKEVPVTTMRGDNPHYQMVLKTNFHQIGDWHHYDEDGEVISLAPGVEYAPAGTVTAWNVGTRSFELKAGDEVLYSTPDKDMALAIAAGVIPIPVQTEAA